MSLKVFLIPSGCLGVLGSSSAQRGQSFFLAKRELKNHAWPQVDAHFLTAWFLLLPSNAAETGAVLGSVSWSTETKTSLLVWILFPWVSSSSRVAQGQSSSAYMEDSVIVFKVFFLDKEGFSWSTTLQFSPPFKPDCERRWLARFSFPLGTFPPGPFLCEWIFCAT